MVEQSCPKSSPASPYGKRDAGHAQNSSDGQDTESRCWLEGMWGTPHEMKQEMMTKKERLKTLLKGEGVDRVLLYPFIMGFCARNVGYPLATIYRDPERSFEAQLWTQEQYGFDWGPVYGYASYGTWEFGGIVKMPEGDYEQAPSHAAFPVQSEEDVDRLKLPEVTTAGALPMAFEFSRLQAKYGAPITLILGGSFTIAGNICPVEKLCRWILKKPELVHQILTLATDHIIDIVKYWADSFVGQEVIVQIWEPLASNEIISPSQFEKFVLPYLQESSQKILNMGIRHIFYHICGEQNLNLPHWAHVPMGNPGICSVGSQIEISTAVAHLGDKAIIAGNIEPNIIQMAKPQYVYELCKKAIEAGKKAPRGFMLMSGCETPPEAPPYNIYMMRRAVEDRGWY
jgi:uroporphyrinogen decarboxylase